MQYLHFWGKAGGVQLNEPSWHPVAYHNLDVAAVADVLLCASPRKLQTIAKLLATTPDRARRILVALIALHDIGKFSTAFQAKSEDAWPKDVLGTYPGRLSGGRHDALASLIRNRLGLKELFGPTFEAWNSRDFNDLWHAISGHHGRPCVEDAERLSEEFTSTCEDAARAYCTDVAALFPRDEAIPLPTLPNLAALTWCVAGLTVIADWIGSNRTWFPYAEPNLSVAEYWRQARDRAANAVARAGIPHIPAAADLSAARLLPAHVANSLSPLQRSSCDLALPDGPMLAIVEDVTGSGKTEAALLLAARLLADRRADGLYFALPTMATANAMYDRLGAIYRKLFDEGVQPSLALAHGKRKLHEGFSASILEEPAGQLAGKDGYEDGAAATCVAWIVDDRRKAFLAHVGVGTIDQAVLGVLPSKHQALRLWGLSDRVLIIDEAHAYDAYVGREIETLLEFHAALSGSAIVLSATLPSALRQSLAAAFARGLGAKKLSTGENHAYPLLTVVSAKGARALPLPSREDRTRALPVRRIASVEDAVDHVADMAQRGAAVAWIRNAVDDAIEAAEFLKSKGLDPVLLHARFAMGDRLEIEQRVTDTLGRKDKTGERAGFVIVGTQILEQSLDYDVDVMITDLAPIDLMIQRAGRLWRHAREGRPVDAPEFVVLSPDPDVEIDEDWYRTLSRRAAAVYDHHGIVWRSAKVLFDTGRIETPAGVRKLIESVYASKELDDIPQALRRKSMEAEGNERAAASIAKSNLLKLGKGYAGEPHVWSSDMIAPTRIGPPTVVFRLAKIVDNRLVPYFSNDELFRAWSLSEVRIAWRNADGVPKGDRARERMIAAAKELWPEWERDAVHLLVLDPDGTGWRGTVSKQGEGERNVLYDHHVGLRYSTIA
ncbi:MAG TPA: CRISPR-associated helicase Cas3' [Hyphomicrobium sp.]|mgnify:CR=1 FL=1|nr:CRISPR-associated helicase Cas3' [Hyphomicrobium sp.]